MADEQRFWTFNEKLTLVAEVRNRSLLWRRPKGSPDERDTAWEEIRQKLPSFSAGDLKGQWKSLRSTYTAQKKKPSGPSWHLWDAFGLFGSLDDEQWTEDEEKTLCSAIKKHPLIWRDGRKRDATSIAKRNAAWEDIQQRLTSYSVGDVQNKWKALTMAYARKKKASNKSWHLWDALGFLDPAHSDDALFAQVSENGNESNDSAPASSSSELNDRRSGPEEEVVSHEQSMVPSSASALDFSNLMQTKAVTYTQSSTSEPIAIPDSSVNTTELTANISSLGRCDSHWNNENCSPSTSSHTAPVVMQLSTTNTTTHGAPQCMDTTRMADEQRFWTFNEKLTLVAEVKDRSILWRRQRGSLAERDAAWEEIRQKLPSFSAGDLKGQWRSLKTIYMEQKKKPSGPSWHLWDKFSFIDSLDDDKQWTVAEEETLCSAIKKHPIIWSEGLRNDATSRAKRYAAWEDVQQRLTSYSVDELKDKWKNLKTTYARKKQATNKSWHMWGALDFLDAAHSDDALVARTSENGNESNDSAPAPSSSELRGRRSEPKEEVDSQENAVGPCAEYKWAVGVSKQDADDNEVLCDRIEINCVQSKAPVP